MNDNKAEVEAIHETEQRFWQLISEVEHLGYNMEHHKPADKLKLREASKIVASSLDDLHDSLLEHRPELLRLSPQFAFDNSGIPSRRLKGDETLSVFDGIVYSPYGEACLYLWASTLTPLPEHNPKGIDVVKAEGEEGREHVLSLRDLKDQDSSDESVRASLRTWVLRRMDEIPGYTSLLLREYGTPIGMLSFYREKGAGRELTRVRDLFISPAYQRRGYSKYLFKKLKGLEEPPYAVVTDLHNKALFQYRQRGFRPVFAQEAYQLIP